MKYKKIVSLNPDKFKMIPASKAITDFGCYCYKCGIRNITSGVKTFEQWLDTEI